MKMISRFLVPHRSPAYVAGSDLPKFSVHLCKILPEIGLPAPTLGVGLSVDMFGSFVLFLQRVGFGKGDD